MSQSQKFCDDKENDSCELLPGMITSFIPVISNKTIIVKLILNCCVTFIFRLKWFTELEGPFFAQIGFPWFLISLFVTVQACFSIHPDYRKYLNDLPFDTIKFFMLMMILRIIFMGPALATERGRAALISVDESIIDVSYMQREILHLDDTLTYC